VKAIRAQTQRSDCGAPHLWPAIRRKHPETAADSRRQGAAVPLKAPSSAQLWPIRRPVSCEPVSLADRRPSHDEDCCLPESGGSPTSDGVPASAASFQWRATSAGGCAAVQPQGSAPKRLPCLHPASEATSVRDRLTRGVLQLLPEAALAHNSIGGFAVVGAGVRLRHGDAFHSGRSRIRPSVHRPTDESRMAPAAPPRASRGRFSGRNRRRTVSRWTSPAPGRAATAGSPWPCGSGPVTSSRTLNSQPRGDRPHGADPSCPCTPTHWTDGRRNG
jgi:hypothetical protein